ncbi:uncharacterized protein DSM5745_03131 [Aspergillus mulundensis]|uniref:Uncharacterized protein n=1 Tax=Aspergillus mulundensis TaxID=1810919 RepID=A0A3D8SJH2_9EURO|nr:hypothetical protein DSM5745_03131 [Aspergillus mulundensis]RDW86489.1 hypothetical protein DSM5745_03131 [Aspergillus mulundensis]
MPEANGSFQWIDQDQVNAIFDVDGQEYKCALRVYEPLDDFGWAMAKLQYDGKDELTGKQQFEGHIGENDFLITFDNKPKIEGDLDSPIDLDIPVMGNGEWI